MAWQEKIKVIEHWALDNILSLAGSLIALLFHSLANKIWKSKTNNKGILMEEKKVVEFKIEGEFLLLSIDPNKDGEKLLELKIMLKEVPDEVLSAFKKD